MTYNFKICNQYLSFNEFTEYENLNTKLDLINTLKDHVIRK